MATGRLTSAGVTVWPVIPTATAVAEIWVWPWNSDAVPVTVTTSPRSTESLLPLKTKMPLGGHRVAICFPVLFLDVEPAKGRRGTLVVTDDDALDA
ncbi:MAG: hypothetical protein WKF47_04510 [Geodermatophilaceae bacterium]